MPCFVEVLSRVCSWILCSSTGLVGAILPGLVGRLARACSLFGFGERGIGEVRLISVGAASLWALFELLPPGEASRDLSLDATSVSLFWKCGVGSGGGSPDAAIISWIPAYPSAALGWDAIGGSVPLATLLKFYPKLEFRWDDLPDGRVSSDRLAYDPRAPFAAGLARLLPRPAKSCPRKSGVLAWRRDFVDDDWSCCIPLKEWRFSYFVIADICCIYLTDCSFCDRQEL